MMTVTKAFKYSPNGYTVETVPAGEHESLPEQAVEIGKVLGVLVEDKSDKKPSGKNKK